MDPETSEAAADQVVDDHQLPDDKVAVTKKYSGLIYGVLVLAAVSILVSGGWLISNKFAGNYQQSVVTNNQAEQVDESLATTTSAESNNGTALAADVNETECDYEALQHQLEEIIGAVKVDYDLWTDIVTSAVSQADFFALSEIGKIEPCSYRVTLSTELSDDFISQSLDLDLYELLESLGWGYAVESDPASGSADSSSSFMLAHAGGPNGNSQIFVLPSSSGNLVQFLRVRDSGRRENFQAYRTGESETPCPCGEDVSLEISPPLQLYPKDDAPKQLSANDTVCDYEALQAQVEDIIGAIDIDYDHWTAASSEEFEQTYAFGSGEMGMIEPCAYSFSFTSERTDEHVKNSLVSDFDKVLLQSGWVNKMEINFVSDSTGASTSIGLFHAGGPQGYEEIYTLPMYDERSVQFAKVRYEGNFENRLAYMDNESDTMCPCWQVVTLELSPPISLAPWLE